MHKRESEITLNLQSPSDLWCMCVQPNLDAFFLAETEMFKATLESSDCDKELLNKVIRCAWNASISLHQFLKDWLGASEYEKLKDQCADLVLLEDIADSYKHKSLNRKRDSRLVNEATAIAIMPNRKSPIKPWGEEMLFSPEHVLQTVVTLKDPIEINGDIVPAGRALRIILENIHKLVMAEHSNLLTEKKNEQLVDS